GSILPGQHHGGTTGAQSQQDDPADNEQRVSRPPAALTHGTIIPHSPPESQYQVASSDPLRRATCGHPTSPGPGTSNGTVGLERTKDGRRPTPTTRGLERSTDGWHHDQV